MTDIKRRHLLTGALAGSAMVGVASAAWAQNTGQNNAEAQGVQAVFPNHSDPATLTVQPAGTDWAQLRRYHLANADAAVLPDAARRVVMMGDSITDGWPGQSDTFFAANGLVGRGIGGQVSAQMLVRFMADVVALRPKAVHIMAGTNDIAQNQDPYDPVATTNNLQAMASLASVYGIRVIMASVPPADHFPWRPEVGNPVVKIKALNAWIRSICSAQNYVYADYWPILALDSGAMRAEFSADGVHPNSKAYAAMAPYTLAAIDAALA